MNGAIAFVFSLKMYLSHSEDGLLCSVPEMNNTDNLNSLPTEAQNAKFPYLTLWTH